ncbi:MAG: aminotransferase class V-fold PLP-dependent enzyme [Pseudomonadota bacterium]
MSKTLAPSHGSAPPQAAGQFPDALMAEVRSRFHHVDHCPITNRPRIFLESGGGSLKLRSAIERTAQIAAIPDQEGRDNDASRHLTETIGAGRADLRLFFGCGDAGQVISGETGTELLYRFVRTAALSAPPGPVISSNLEHPASFDAAKQWAKRTGRQWREVEFDPIAATVRPEDYARAVTPDTQIATVIHTSQLTGFRVDLAGIVEAIRSTAPDCVIIVDGIQQAPHGHMDLSGVDVDGYVFSPYKAYSRLAVGFGWVSDRLSAMPHDHMLSKPEHLWELGSRDPGIYAAQSAVTDYFAWLGTTHAGANDRADAVVAGTHAMVCQERGLIELLLHGKPGVPGLFSIPGVAVIGPEALNERAGIVSFSLRGMPSPQLVRKLAERDIRVHARIDDGYSGHILAALDLKDCLRIALCHYNTVEEIETTLTAIAELANA